MPKSQVRMCPMPNDQGPAQVSKAKVSKAQQRGASASLNYKLTLGTVFGFKIPVPSAECMGKPEENERKMRWGDAIKILHFKKEKFSLWPKASLQATGSSGLRAKLHTPPRHTPKQRPPSHTKPYHLSRSDARGRARTRSDALGRARALSDARKITGAFGRAQTLGRARALGRARTLGRVPMRSVALGGAGSQAALFAFDEFVLGRGSCGHSFWARGIGPSSPTPKVQ